MTEELLRELQSLGFRDKEARVYLALLEMGPGPVQELAIRSGVNRATTYLIIEALRARGLVSAFEEGKRTMLVAESPHKLEEMIENDLRCAKEKRGYADAVIPKLSALYRAREKPTVRFFEGEEGIRSLRESVSEVKSAWCDSFIRLDAAMQRLASAHSDDRFVSFRGKERFRFLYVEEPDVRIPKFPKSFEHRIEIRTASHIPIEFDGEIGMLESFVYMVSMQPKTVGCIVESRQMSNLFRAQFELAWTSAQPIPSSFN